MFANCDDILVATTGYTGAGGVEIYCKNDAIHKIWEAVLDAGKEFGIQPIGLAARDTLRLEMGYCLYGNEIDDNTSPIAAGLGWVTRPETNFLNAEQLGKKKYWNSGKLVGFELIERGIPRNGHPILNAEGKNWTRNLRYTIALLRKGHRAWLCTKRFSRRGTIILDPSTK